MYTNVTNILAGNYHYNTEQDDIPALHFDTLMEFQNIGLQKLYEYWNDLRNGRDMPSRREMLPEELTFCLNQIALVEPIRQANGSLTFRLLSTGQDLEILFGPMNGRLISELNITDLGKERWHQELRVAWSYGRPLRHKTNLADAGRTWIDVEGISLPLANRFGDYQYMVIGLSYQTNVPEQ